MKLYIIVRNYMDETPIEEGVMYIESVWQNRQQAESALLFHARSANIPSHLYSIIERDSDTLTKEN